ncbi:uncharacterized protein K02A2.6-like [Leptopilina boulardi]|uniref:uncharacterized protein K02A2.6-like n=1 Tax=Leptopilina boulardi TaxID=63433 RepID=UPI0021F55BBD|nr:uncharacterized protein K02A2.6-like [Leptopilina boulardi]
MVEAVIGNEHIQAEIDSGAGRSVIPESVYSERLSEYKLSAVKTTLRLYDGTIIQPLGQINVDLTVGGKSVPASLLVVKHGCRMLIGRDLMTLLGFRLTQINSLEPDEELRKLLQEFESLFDGKPGCYKYEKIDMRIIENANPIFCKPRPVPFAFKGEMDGQLDKLVKDEIISPIADNEWGTPLVPVLKKDGGLRVCADYKVTVNKVLEDVCLLASLSGRKKFSKLDLASAFNQLQVTEKTSKILAWSTHRGIFKVNRVPFGPKTAVAIFQKIIEKTLQGVPNVVIFLDDVVVTERD